MTKKDYEILAEALANGWPKTKVNYIGYTLAIHAIVEALTKNNPKFQIRKFTKACKIPS